MGDTSNDVGNPQPGPASANAARGTRRLSCEAGLESIEVALIAAAVVLTVIGGVPLVTGGVQHALTSVASALSAAGGIN
jgi:Flp pilus assembly pilin Flp